MPLPVSEKSIEIDPRLTGETKKILLDLNMNPRRPFRCIFGDGPAIVFRQMLAGCIALPNRIEQPLCAQHDHSRTPMSDVPDGDLYVVDLSIMGQWSRHTGEQPLFVIDPAVGLANWLSIR